MNTTSTETAASAQPAPAAPPGVRHILFRMAGLKGAIWDLALATFFLNLLGLALPLSLLHTYDRILPNRAVGTLIALVVGVIGTTVLETVLRIARATISGWLSSRFEYRASKRAFSGLLHMPIEEFDRKGTGAHFECLDAVNQLKDFYSGQNFLFLLDIPFAFTYLLLIGLFTGWLVVVPMALMGLFGLAAVGLGRRTRAALEKRMHSDDLRGNFIVEVLSGIHGIKSMAMEALMMRRFERLLESNVAANLKVSHYGGLASTLAQTFASLTTISVVGLGSILVVRGHITPGILAACSLLAGRCIQPVQGALDRWNRYQMVEPAEDRLTDLFTWGDDDLAGKSEEGKLDLTELEGRITLEDVAFQYGEGQFAVQPLSLTIHPNDCIGISGENGSGKSVLLSMLCGRLAPSQGRVLLDGHDIASLSRDCLDRYIAYVPQQPELFRGTIMQNLTLFVPEREAEARAAAKALGVDRVVAALPRGYETIVGEGAQDGLPQGIRQMIVIARALAQTPRVLLFDEANTALDGAGDLALRKALENLKGRCTVVLVTPRPSALSIADRTFKLVEGRLEDSRQVIPGAPALKVLPGTAPVAEILPPPANDPGRAAVPDDEDRLYMDFLAEVEKGSALGRCLYPLLHALNWSEGLRPLAEALPHFKTELDIQSFLNVLSCLHYRSETLQGRMTGMPSHLLPCLFITRDGQPKVLLRREGEMVRLFDGESGGERLEDPDHLVGTAYFVSRLSPEERGVQAGRSWFADVLSRFRGVIWAVLGVSLIINLLSLGTPLFTMSIYDTVIAAGDLSMLPAFVIGILIVVFGYEILKELRHNALNFLGGRISYLVMSAVFGRTLMLPLPLTERATVGSQLSRFKDLESVRDFFGGLTASVLVDMPFVVVYLVLLFVLSPWVMLVPLVALAVFGVAAAALMPLVLDRTRQYGQASMARQEFVIEALLKMRALRYAGLEKVWRRRYVEMTAQTAMAGYRSGQLMMTVASLSQSLTVITGILTMAVGAMVVMQGGMSSGGLIASMMLVWRVLAPVQSGIAVFLRLSQTRASARQVDGLMSFRTERDSGAGSSSGMAFDGMVSFNRVSLRYLPEADPALVGVSFQARPGEVVAIVGPDGAGKSTLLKMVAGLYTPQAGNVQIDNFDIRQLDPITLRQTLAYVPQAASLFHGTIAQNLRLAHPTASDAELREALALAGATAEVEALGNGMHTRIGDSRTNRLPASLIQKLSLARAYLKKSPVLLLDEPVSGLDFEGDTLFKTYIEAVKGRSTVIMVTQRPSHLTLADQIVVMDRGSVVLAGPAEEVRKRLMGGGEAARKENKA